MVWSWQSAITYTTAQCSPGPGKVTPLLTSALNKNTIISAAEHQQPLQHNWPAQHEAVFKLLHSIGLFLVWVTLVVKGHEYCQWILWKYQSCVAQTWGSIYLNFNTSGFISEFKIAPYKWTISSVWLAPPQWPTILGGGFCLSWDTQAALRDDMRWRDAVLFWFNELKGRF